MDPRRAAHASELEKLAAAERAKLTEEGRTESPGKPSVYQQILAAGHGHTSESSVPMSKHQGTHTRTLHQLAEWERAQASAAETATSHNTHNSILEHLTTLEQEAKASSSASAPNTHGRWGTFMAEATKALEVGRVHQHKFEASDAPDAFAALQKSKDRIENFAVHSREEHEAQTELQSTLQSVLDSMKSGNKSCKTDWNWTISALTDRETVMTALEGAISGLDSSHPIKHEGMSIYTFDHNEGLLGVHSTNGHISLYDKGSLICSMTKGKSGEGTQ
ncbi:uncharacterized protein I303_101676 [Kwoniella dejecticola CBS 10117]|uniref:Uncharacterized protein n=1 Tax=Kwoniella dejecticola CBS 10117 TaxID=1296121 RepID=A0A1A6AD28_9TREE|nr:uncharacterized protein I303_02188 [Kwoniella dejecticola CBS 10117]OBR87972.1 hypothetical protein I303_02188 [Kwoniella dejecticola CBS 10117]